MRRLAGTGTVSSPEAKTVSVDYDDAEVGVEEIRRAVLSAGYDSTVLS